MPIIISKIRINFYFYFLETKKFYSNFLFLNLSTKLFNCFFALWKIKYSRLFSFKLRPSKLHLIFAKYFLLEWASKIETLMDLMISFLIKKHCKKVDVHRSRKIFRWDKMNYSHISFILQYIFLYFPPFNRISWSDIVARIMLDAVIASGKIGNSLITVPRYRGFHQASLILFNWTKRFFSPAFYYY